MADLHVWHDSCLCVDDSFIGVTLLIRCAWYRWWKDAFICVTPNLWHDSSICVTWLIECISYDRHRIPRQIAIGVHSMSHVTFEYAMSHMNKSHHLVHELTSCFAPSRNWCALNEARQIWMSHGTYGRFLSRCRRDRVTRLIECAHLDKTTHCIYVTWLIHIWDMTHSYVGHDSFICGTWLIHMWDMTHSYVGHDSFICETWLIHMCDMTHPHVWHDSCRVIDRIGNPIRHVKYKWALGLLAKCHLVCTQNYRSLLRISALS